MCFEVADGYFGGILTVTTGGNKFEFHLVLVLDEMLSTYLHGAMLACYTRNMKAWYARVISASFWFFIGSTRIPLLLMSTMTMMCFFAR